MNKTSSSSFSSSSTLLKAKADTLEVSTPQADEIEALLKRLSEMDNVADHASRRVRIIPILTNNLFNIIYN